MQIEYKRTTYANKDNQEALNDFAKVIRREGVILDRFDSEGDKGPKSGFFIEWDGDEYFLKMLKGDVTSLRKMWKVEE